MDRKGWKILIIYSAIMFTLMAVVYWTDCEAAEGHPACASCHEEQGIDAFNIPPGHIMVPLCARCHIPTEEKAPEHPPLHEEIPPELMKELRERVFRDQATLNDRLRMPNLNGYPEHIRPVCMNCHGDLQAMAKAADGVLTDEEMLMHTLFLRNVTVFKPIGLRVIMIVPTDNIDVIKDPNEICIMTQRNYPGSLIEIVHQQRASGENIKHKCTQIYPAALR